MRDGAYQSIGLDRDLSVRIHFQEKLVRRELSH